MPDLQNFSVTRTGNTVNGIPEYAIEGQVCDSQSGAVLRDFTGANGVKFPQILATVTAAQRDVLVQLLVRELIRIKTGL